MSKDQKHFLVVGGTGSIGRRIVGHLVSRQIFVDTMARGETDPEVFQGTRAVDGRTMIRDVRCDVTRYSAVKDCFTDHFSRQGPLDGIVYCVGQCSLQGFDAAVSVPLSDMTPLKFSRDFDQQVTGFFNIMACFLRHVEPSGHVVVIGSAITRLTDEKCPAFLKAGHYAAAKAAQHELVRWYRRDELVRENRVCIHYLAPIAVDTPFHQDCERRPPAMISVDTVAKEVMKCLDRSTPVDKVISSPSCPT